MQGCQIQSFSLSLMICYTSSYLTEINPSPGSNGLGSQEFTAVWFQDAAAHFKTRWKGVIDSLLILGDTVVTGARSLFVGGLLRKERTHLYRPSCSGRARIRRSSRRCSLLARERSGRFHTHSGSRIPLPADPRSHRSALIGHRNM